MQGFHLPGLALTQPGKQLLGQNSAHEDAWPLPVPKREFHREPSTVEGDDGRGRHGDGGAEQHLRPA